MTVQAQSLLREALNLEEEERALLAGALLESLETEIETDVESAWRREVGARVASSKAGGVETTAWEAIRDRFEIRLSESRSR